MHHLSDDRFILFHANKISIHSVQLPTAVAVDVIVGCITKFMLTTKALFDTGIILGKMHCSRNFINNWSCFEANSNQLNAFNTFFN